MLFYSHSIPDLVKLYKGITAVWNCEVSQTVKQHRVVWLACIWWWEELRPLRALWRNAGDGGDFMQPDSVLPGVVLALYRDISQTLLQPFCHGCSTVVGAGWISRVGEAQTKGRRWRDFETRRPGPLCPAVKHSLSLHWNLLQLFPDQRLGPAFHLTLGFIQRSPNMEGHWDASLWLKTCCVATSAQFFSSFPHHRLYVIDIKLSWWYWNLCPILQIWTHEGRALFMFSEVQIVLLYLIFVQSHWWRTKYPWGEIPYMTIVQKSEMSPNICKIYIFCCKMI